MKPMSAIRNLLFDMGGVIVDLDRDRCLQALLNIGLEDADNLIVTPKDVETKVKTLSKIIANAINFSFTNLSKDEYLELTI